MMPLPSCCWLAALLVLSSATAAAAAPSAPSDSDQAPQHSSAAASSHANASLPQWLDSSVGVHEFSTVDTGYKGRPADIKDAASHFDFIWGSDMA